MPNRAPDKASLFLEAWYVLWLTALVSLLGVFLEAFADYHAVGFLFLLFVMLLGLRFSVGPVLFGAGLSALVWALFFIPPRLSLGVSTSEDLVMLLSYAVAAGLIGSLSQRMRRMQSDAAARDRRSRYMVVFARILASDDGMQTVVLQALAQVEQRFDLRAALFLPGRPGLLTPRHLLLGDNERELMALAARTGQPVGWDGLYPRHRAVPLGGAGQDVPVLLLRRALNSELPEEDLELLTAVSGQLAYFIQRESLRERSLEAERLRESELLHQALLDSVSHELRTPLTSLLGSAAALEDPGRAQDPGSQRALLGEIRDAGERLNRVIENLLDMARLNTGALALRKEWHDPSELARLTVQRLARPLAGHRITLDLPSELPLVQVDYRLLEHALSNLLLNAAVHAPAGSEIAVSTRADDEQVRWTVADRGPGIPADDLEHVFEKFFRVPGSPAGGTGLGLHITRSLLQAHGGRAQARNRDGGGAEFELSLPLGPRPALPSEVAA